MKNDIVQQIEKHMIVGKHVEGHRLEGVDACAVLSRKNLIIGWSSEMIDPKPEAGDSCEYDTHLQQIDPFKSYIPFLFRVIF